ncbi:melatonin receptor type 1A-like [Protopterus annectens]|uniref:melatonin receptor type 1A-like n=1 Tax=Protopterus annectens TaxID=7888 RepID=UPI001CFB907A|nr:melatonin receptor type 1A-like [Protopterus annectens]
MSTENVEFSNVELQTIIKILFPQKKTPKEIHECMMETLSGKCPSYSTVKKGCANFQCGNFKTEDAARSGRPQKVPAPEIVDHVHDLIMAGNIFVVSLAVADLLLAVYPYPVSLLSMIHNGWILGEIQCKASGFVQGLSVVGSVFNITAIAINRYCFICHNKIYSKLYSLKNTYGCLGLIWTLAIAAVLPSLCIDAYQYNPKMYCCTLGQTVSSAFTTVTVTIHFLVPIIIVVFCYVRIWALVLAVRYRARQDNKQKLKPHEIRNFFSMFMVFVVFAVCWGPPNFTALAIVINPTKVIPGIPPWMFSVNYFMGSFNCFMNSILYGLLNKNFRTEYVRICITVCDFTDVFSYEDEQWVLKLLQQPLTLGLSVPFLLGEKDEKEPV